MAKISYNPTRISFEVSPEKKETLQVMIPNGKVSKVYQNFTEYLLTLGKTDLSAMMRLVYTTDMDFMEISESVQESTKESVTELLNQLRVSVGLERTNAVSISSIKKSITEMLDATSNRRFL
jgi:hypothetical protein